MTKKFFIVIAIFTLLFSGQIALADDVKLQNPLGSTVNDPQVLIGKVINSLLGLVGSLALLIFIYGGLTWMIAGGSQEKIKKGRDIIVWSAIGLIIVFSSYGLVRFLLSSIK